MKSRLPGAEDLVLAFIIPIAFWAFLWLMWSSHRQSDAALEQRIGAAEREAQILRQRARTTLPKAERLYVQAAASQSRYDSLRKPLRVDPVAMTIAGPTFTPQRFPEPIVQLVLACDTAMARLRPALDTTRAGWALERAAADTQLVVDSLKDLRHGDRCGFKCGVAVGAASTAVVITVAVKIVRALADRPRTSNLALSPP